MENIRRSERQNGGGDKASAGGNTALHAAADHGHPECVRALLEAGADVNKAGDGGDTALHAAARYGNADSVRALCEAGADVNTEMAGRPILTPLYSAIMRDQSECVRVLCEAGADVNQAADGGATPLQAAAMKGQTDCVRALLEYGASVNHGGGAGVTPLFVAARQGHTFCVHLLSSYGARDEHAADGAANRGHVELTVWLRHAQAWTPLHHLEVLTPARALALLRGGADLHAGSPSPLERARTVPGEVSALVVRAGRQWSPQTHHLFPATARLYAAEVLRLGYLLAWSPRYTGEASSLVDVWLGYVLPYAVERD